MTGPYIPNRVLSRLVGSRMYANDSMRVARPHVQLRGAPPRSAVQHGRVAKPVRTGSASDACLQVAPNRR